MYTGMSKITIVIPCYNASAYIGRCIQALERQAFTNFKVLFVDDFSTDDTVDVLSSYRDITTFNFEILHNESNNGPAYSRNQGILKANSEFITFCDCDDWYDSNFLERLYSMLLNTNSDIVFCGYKVVDEYGNSQVRPLTDKSGKISREEVFGLDADSLCMMMVKTSIMKDTLLPNLRNGEDVATVPLLMARSNSYAVTNDCLYNYFRRKGSSSQKPCMKVVESLVASFDYTKNNLPMEYRHELEYIGVKNMLYGALITLFSFSYDTEKAENILSHFEKEFPKWYSNSLISNLSLYKRLVLHCLRFRCFFCVKLMAFVRSRVIN